MTLLKQLEVWVTGSNLSKDVRKLRLKLHVWISLCLLVIFGISSIFASNIFNSLSPSSTVDVILKNRLRGVRVDRDVFEDLKDNLIEERSSKFVNSLYLSNLILYLIVIFVLWFGLYFVLKPVSDSFNEKEKFLKYASHDLRTPLAILSSNIGLIDKESTKSEMMETLKLSGIEISRLKNLANNYLDRLEGKKTGLVESLNLRSEIQNCIDNIGIEAVDMSIDKDFTLNIENKQSFNQLIYNIIDNMKRHGSKPYKIELFNKSIKFTNSFQGGGQKESTGISIIDDLCSELGYNKKIYKKDKEFIVEIYF